MDAAIRDAIRERLELREGVPWWKPRPYVRVRPAGWTGHHKGVRGPVPMLGLMVNGKREQVRLAHVVAVLEGRVPSERQRRDGAVVSHAEIFHDPERLNRNNTSGRVGVTFDTRRRKWVAQIQIDGRNRALGRHDTFEAAVAAREAGERRYWSRPVQGEAPT
jgi:hypothetical protein